MEYTQSQKDEFKQQFAIRRKRQIVLVAPLFILILIMATADEASGSAIGGIPISVIAPVTLAAILGGIVFSLKNWRCPACGKYLGKAMNPNFCPKCGIGLR
jgi:hypothetical protein